MLYVENLSIRYEPKWWYSWNMVVDSCTENGLRTAVAFSVKDIGMNVKRVVRYSLDVIDRNRKDNDSVGIITIKYMRIFCFIAKRRKPWFTVSASLGTLTFSTLANHYYTKSDGNWRFFPPYDNDSLRTDQRRISNIVRVVDPVDNPAW